MQQHDSGVGLRIDKMPLPQGVRPPLYALSPHSRMARNQSRQSSDCRLSFFQGMAFPPGS